MTTHKFFVQLKQLLSDILCCTFSGVSKQKENTARDYRFELVRLKSFKNWRCPWIKPKQLAAAGLYYTGNNDVVKCFECNVEIRSWNQYDSPQFEHQFWSPSCSFIRNYPCGNVPLGDELKNIPPFPKGRDVCGLYDDNLKTPPNHCDDNVKTSKQFKKLLLEEIEKTEDIKDIKRRIIEVNNSNFSAIKPEYPEYASFDARLHTFDMLRKFLPDIKEQFAVAGLFYIGNDKTLCYHCGVELNVWELENPWKQHAICFNRCPYLLTVRGINFINRAATNSDQVTIDMCLAQEIQLRYAEINNEHLRSQLRYAEMENERLARIIAGDLTAAEFDLNNNNNHVPNLNQN